MGRDLRELSAWSARRQRDLDQLGDLARLGIGDGIKDAQRINPDAGQALRHGILAIGRAVDLGAGNAIAHDLAREILRAVGLGESAHFCGAKGDNTPRLSSPRFQRGLMESMATCISLQRKERVGTARLMMVVFRSAKERILSRSEQYPSDSCFSNGI